MQVNSCGKFELGRGMGFIVVEYVFGQPQSPIPSVRRYSTMLGKHDALLAIQFQFGFES
jgi:hypothetical protein